ncbi:helix-turn-helix domain-containing protein [Nocardiopsis alba]|uniref:helix-turn-helix domain-containing protein n=1 Tax=Nocardiopsis alba TaxID=53437 RepID=UPI00366F5DD9
MPQTSPFAEWLISTGRALGYTTNTSLAKALGVPQPTVSRWKSGSKPSVEHLVKISELFGVELKTLLILSGHIQGDIVKEVHPPLNQAERMISDAQISAGQKQLIVEYWRNRMGEEHARLARVVAFAEEAVEAGGPPLGLEFAAKESKSDLAPHLALWHMRFLGTLPFENRFDYSAGVEEPETGWLRPPELIGVELPKGYAIQFSQPDEEGARVTITAPGGAPIAWTRAFPTHMEALEQVPEMLQKTPKAPLSAFGDTDAPEEEDQG